MATTITDVDELQAMNNDLTEDYVLGGNIDASATSGWNANAGFVPIGTAGSAFTGTFDGAGYTISDLYIDRSTTDDVGLFGATWSSVTIEDVGLVDVDITGDDDVGGLIGDSNYATVTECYVTGTVTGDDQVGGLIGDHGSTSTIDECYSTAIVTGSDDNVGGLIGYSLGTVDESYATGAVTGDQYVGGLVGSNVASAISDCYATGAVTGDTDVGGLIGNNSDDATNCYSTGAVTGNTNVGGLVGRGSTGITACFWDTQTSGQTTSAAGTGKSTAQMKDYCTFHFADWDIWKSGQNYNNGYPYLGWQYSDDTAVWAILGNSGTRCFDIPNVLDDHGRPPKGAVVRAYRSDTNAEITAARTVLDANGKVTICDLPLDVDIMFHVTWGGGG